MRQGRIVEQGPASQVVAAPQPLHGRAAGSGAPAGRGGRRVTPPAGIRRDRAAQAGGRRPRRDPRAGGRRRAVTPEPGGGGPGRDPGGGRRPAGPEQAARAGTPAEDATRAAAPAARETARAATRGQRTRPRPTPPLLEITDLAVRFGPVRAVDGVSLGSPPGRSASGWSGESGSGKTTIGRAVLRLVPAAGGQIRFEGADVATLRGPGAQASTGAPRRSCSRTRQQP